VIVSLIVIAAVEGSRQKRPERLRGPALGTVPNFQ